MLMQRRFLWRRLWTTSSFIIKWKFSNNNRLSLFLEIFLPWNWLYSSILFTLFLLFLIDTLEDLKFEFTTSNPSIEYSFLLQDPEESILPDKTDSRTLRVSSSGESPQTVIINNRELEEFEGGLLLIGIQNLNTQLLASIKVAHNWGK